MCNDVRLALETDCNRAICYFALNPIRTFSEIPAYGLYSLYMMNIEKYFREGLFENDIHEKGAIELLKHLYGKYTLCVAGNGPYLQQKNRLKRTCFYNPKTKPVPQELKINYNVASLKEIESII